MESFKEVSKEEFFRVIAENRLNVHPHPRGNYPYTSIWEYPNGAIFGRSVNYIPEGRALHETRYYLAEKPA